MSPVIVTTTSDLPLEEGDDAQVILRSPVLVAVGEYASEGQPDVLVHVVHALDQDGQDVRGTIARVIAKALDQEEGSP